MRLHLSLIAAIAAGGFLACSGGGGSVATTSGTGGNASAMDGVIAEYCDAHGSCCSEEQKTYDRDICLLTLKSIAAGGEIPNAVKANECVTLTRAARARPDFCKTGVGSKAKQACFEAFEGMPAGTSIAGQPCEDTRDCAAPAEGSVRCLTTSASDGATRRFCQVEVIGVESQKCDATLHDGFASGFGGGVPKLVVCDFDAGLYCPAPGAKCTRVSGPGGPCGPYESDGVDYFSTQYACTRDAYCDVQGKTCIAKKTAGVSCESYEECAEGFHCHATRKLCVAQLDVGTACTDSAECRYGHCKDGLCAKSSVSDGICR
jgi:hypothetical protein